MKKLIFVLLVLLITYFGYYFYQQKDIPFMKKFIQPTLVENQKQEAVITPSEEINRGEASSQNEKLRTFFLEIESPVNGAIVNQPTITVRGKTLPQAEVFVNDLQLKAKSDGSFSTPISLDEGENTLTIVANDNQGNYIEKEIVVKLETLE